jgi:hypothetical protein
LNGHSVTIAKGTPISCHWHAWGKGNTLIQDHVIYHQLGMTHVDRQSAFRDLFKLHITDDDIHRIRMSLNINHPLGNVRFKVQIEKALGRSVGQCRVVDLAMH